MQGGKPRSQERLRSMLRETITLLCTNGLEYQEEFTVEALIGITTDKRNIMLVNLNETVRSSGKQTVAHHQESHESSDGKQMKMQNRKRPPLPQGNDPRLPVVKPPMPFSPQQLVKSLGGSNHGPNDNKRKKMEEPERLPREASISHLHISQFGMPTSSVTSMGFTDIQVKQEQEDYDDEEQMPRDEIVYIKEEITDDSYNVFMADETFKQKQKQEEDFNQSLGYDDDEFCDDLDEHSMSSMPGWHESFHPMQHQYEQQTRPLQMAQQQQQQRPPFTARSQFTPQQQPQQFTQPHQKQQQPKPQFQQIRQPLSQNPSAIPFAVSQQSKLTHHNSAASAPAASGRRGAATDAEGKKMFMGSKVRCTILCSLCNKPRCIYSHYKLNSTQMEAVSKARDEDTYVCGESLFPPDHPLHDVISTKSDLLCEHLIETPYYTASHVALTPCCAHCGTYDSLLPAENPYMHERLAAYQIVRPICAGCRDSGVEAVVRGNKNHPRSRARVEKARAVSSGLPEDGDSNT